MAGRKKDGTLGKGIKSYILDSRKKRLVELLIDNGGNFTKTCQDLDISRMTAYKWCREDATLKAILESPEYIRDCARTQADLHSTNINAKAVDNVTASIAFFNNKDNIMKCLGLFPTKMDMDLREITCLSDIDKALDDMTKALHAGKLSEKEFDKMKSIMELRRDVYKDLEVIEELTKIKKQLNLEEE